MIARVPGLVILPGYACNFHCAHCVSSGRKKTGLTEREINRLARTISAHKVRSLHFVGGEPTLYKSTINRLIPAAEPGGKISITTNGHFAGDEGAAARELASFARLDGVQLSYDRFHAKFLPFANIHNLCEACKKSKIRFSVILTLQSPMDLLLVKELKKAGDFPIGLQKVLPFGAAKLNEIGYAYPAFDKRVLSKKCPNRKKIAYLCGHGFSVCCGGPDLRPGPVKYMHPTLEAHKKSRFYRMITELTFSRMMTQLGVTAEWLSPEHSSPCTLCARIFYEYGKT